MLVASRVLPVPSDYRGRCRRGSIYPPRGQKRDDVLNTPHMQRILAIALGGLATWVLLQSTDASAQSGLDRRLAAAKKLDCSFSTFALGNWDKSTPSLTVKPVEFK